MSDDENYTSDFVPFGTFRFSEEAVELIEDYVRRIKHMQRPGSFAVVVEWADDRRSRNVDGVSWTSHGPGLCLHTVDLFAMPPEAAQIFESAVVAIRIPAFIRERCKECCIDVDPWTLPDSADPKSPMPGMGTIGLIAL
ncbi:hypothetical protein X566_15630 [Afipia sp. P52-10]|jgi:hypothetical protein|uniref:hypothetical protein n=1 Tax=Afipia sp. P52-10 TaxID=1429916 RepID=UPI0003DF1BCE|nr:hypothetical protein [Afipia sp. P52-10]ETR76400.1 hypothetical protein X566_15630 [Afipia sp. P52-10]